jgi:hypothetical protein
MFLKVVLLKKVSKSKRVARLRQQLSLNRFLRKRRWLLLCCKRRRNRTKSKASLNYLCALKYVAPKIVTLTRPDHRKQLLLFLAEIRGHFLGHQSRTLLIDFSATERFVSDGTLLLFAELNRLVLFTKQTVKLRCKVPNNSRASEVLKQIGIYRLCSNKCTITPSSDDVVHWKVAQGELVDNSLCAEPIEGFEGKITTEMINELLGGLAEAMTNAIHHAYDGIREDGLNFASPKNWWMFSQVKDGFLSVVFCDLGVGIPTTLPIKQPGLWGRLILSKPIPSHSDCIREAIVEGATRTGMDGRGYGLGDIVNVVRKIPNSRVQVFSNCGYYSSIQTDNAVDFVDSILGTLILWTVPISVSI